MNYYEENILKLDFNKNNDIYKLITHNKKLTFENYLNIYKSLTRDKIFTNITKRGSVNITIDKKDYKFKINTNNVKVCFDKDIFTITNNKLVEYYMIIKYNTPCLNLTNGSCDLPQIYIDEMNDKNIITPLQVIDGSNVFRINENITIYIAIKLRPIYNVYYNNYIDKQLKEKALEGYPIDDLNNIYVDSKYNIKIIQHSKDGYIDAVGDENNNKESLKNYLKIHNNYFNNNCDKLENDLDNDFTCTDNKCISKDDYNNKKIKKSFKWSWLTGKKSDDDDEDEPVEEEKPIEENKEDSDDEDKPVKEEKPDEQPKEDEITTSFYNKIKDFIRYYIDNGTFDDYTIIDKAYEDIPKDIPDYDKVSTIYTDFHSWIDNKCSIIHLRNLIGNLNDDELNTLVDDKEAQIFSYCKPVYITLFTDDDNNKAIQNCSGSTCKNIISGLDNLTMRIENGDFTEQITQLSSELAKSQTEYTASIDKLTTENNQLKNELAQSQSSYTSLLNDCGKDIDEYTAKINNLTTEKEQLSQELEKAEKRIEELTQNLEEAEKLIDELRQ